MTTHDVCVLNKTYSVEPQTAARSLRPKGDQLDVIAPRAGRPEVAMPCGWSGHWWVSCGGGGSGQRWRCRVNDRGTGGCHVVVVTETRGGDAEWMAGALVGVMWWWWR